MKRKLLVSGLLVWLLALGLVFVSCNSESGPSFNGTWTNSWDGGNYITYKFSGSSFTCTYAFPNEKRSGSFAGTFSHTGTAITFNLEGETWTQQYVLTELYLDLTRDAAGHFSGRYMKQ